MTVQAVELVSYCSALNVSKQLCWLRQKVYYSVSSKHQLKSLISASAKFSELWSTYVVW